MRRWPASIVLACLLVAVAAGCSSPAPGAGASPSPDSTVRPDGDRAARGATTSTTIRSTVYRTESGTGDALLVVVGDSITNEGRVEIAARFDRDRRVVIDGRPGYLIGAQQPTAVALAAMGPSAVIIALGTNDAVYAHDPVASAGDLRRLVDTFGSVSCIVLVTVNTRLPRAGAPARALALNEAIRSLAAGDPRLRVVDVDRVAADAESDAGFVAPFLYDGVHPTAAGQARLAAAYAAAVASCPA